MFKMFYSAYVFCTRRVSNIALVLLLAFTSSMLVASPVTASSNNNLQIYSPGGSQNVQLGMNKSVIVDLPLDVSEVIVSQPNIAGAIMRTRRRAIIQGAAIGETNVFFLDAQGRRIAVIEISVVNDAATLSSALKRIIPTSNIQVDSFGDRVILSGSAQSTDDIERIMAIAEQFAGGSGNVANVITISGAQQVMLKVTIAEVGRETVKQMGIDLSASLSLGGLSTGILSTQPLGGASGVINSNALTAGVGAGGLAISATLRALERRGALRTLAEPTLTALSGEEAEFLVGGEFPVPVGIENGVITFEFKEFGIGLNFTPTVRSNGIIGLQVETSVSEPTTEGGFTAGGITIPATRERMAKTSVQLRAGSTLAIAGLIEDKVRQQFNSLPGIGDIPIIGALFRSRDFVRSQTELLILVTPYLAQPGAMVRLPTDNVNFSGDAEAIFLGHMERMYGVGEAAGAGLYNGSVGFILD